MMRWELRAEEALILEFEAYDGFWMITSEAIFGNSMDFLYRPVSYTPSRTAVDNDGKIRLILTRHDPGFSNWIDNQGYTSGVLTFRSVLSRHVPELRTKLVKAAELADHLPTDSKKSTHQDRTRELHHRFDAIRRRYRI